MSLPRGRRVRWCWLALRLRDVSDVDFRALGSTSEALDSLERYSLKVACIPCSPWPQRPLYNLRTLHNGVLHPIAHTTEVLGCPGLCVSSISIPGGSWDLETAYN